MDIILRLLVETVCSNSFILFQYVYLRIVLEICIHQRVSHYRKCSSSGRSSSAVPTVRTRSRTVGPNTDIKRPRVRCYREGERDKGGEGQRGNR